MYRLCDLQVILLIYEYIATSYATEESRNSIKYFQIIMNNTMRSKSNDEISSNEKFGLDRRTLNILQILLNSLKHNELLDNITKESYVTSTSVTTDKLSNNEYSSNVDTGAKKKLQALELNHIPIYLLNSIRNRNINSSRFARKIEKNKEHNKRLLDYFYKMINGRFENTYPRKNDDNVNKKNDHTFNDIFTSYNKNKTYSTTTEKQIKSICVCSKYIQNVLNNFTRHLIDVLTSYTFQKKETESQIEKNNLSNTFWNNISSVYNKATNTLQNYSINNLEVKKILTQTHLPTIETKSQFSLRGDSYTPNYLSNHKTISNATKFNISAEHSNHSDFVNREFKNAKTKFSDTRFINTLPGYILKNDSTVKNVKINFHLNNAEKKVNTTEIYSLENKNSAKFEKITLHFNISVDKSKEKINNFSSRTSIPNSPTNLEVRQNNMKTISNGSNHFNKPILPSKYNKNMILTYHNKSKNSLSLDSDKNNSGGEINLYSSSEENSKDYNTFIDSFKNINSLGQILFLKDEVINKYYTTERPFTGESQNNFYYNFFNNLVKMNNTSTELDTDIKEINLENNSVNQQEINYENKTKPSYDFKDMLQIGNQNNPAKIKLLVHNTTKVNYSIKDYLKLNNEKKSKFKSMPIEDIISSTQNPTNWLEPDDDIIDFTDNDILSTSNHIDNFTQPNNGSNNKNGEDFVDVDEWIPKSYDDILSLNFSNYDYIEFSEESIKKTTGNQIPIANINRIIKETKKFNSVVNNSTNTLHSNYKQVPITNIHRIKNETKKVGSTVNSSNNTLYSLSRLQFVKNVSINPFLHENKTSNLRYANQSQTIKAHTNIVNSSKYANNYTNITVKKTEKDDIYLKDEPIEDDKLFLKSENLINFDELSYNDIVSGTSMSPTVSNKIQSISKNISEPFLNKYDNKTQAPLRSKLLQSSETVNNNETFEQLFPNNKIEQYLKNDTMNDILYKKPSFLIIKRNEWWKDGDISNSNNAKYYR